MCCESSYMESTIARSSGSRSRAFRRSVRPSISPSLILMPVMRRSGLSSSTSARAAEDDVALATTSTFTRPTTWATVSSQRGCWSTRTAVRLLGVLTERAAFRLGVAADFARCTSYLEGSKGPKPIRKRGKPAEFTRLTQDFSLLALTSPLTTLWTAPGMPVEKAPLDVQDEAVVRERHAVRGRQLDRAVGEEDGPVRGRERLLGREVAAGHAVAGAFGQGCLAEKEVGAAGQLRELVGGGGVARVGERLAVLGDAEAVRGERVVRKPPRLDLEAGRGEGHVRLELTQLERLLEHARVAPVVREVGELAPAPGREPERALDPVLGRAEGVQPGPGHEVSPVVEVEVRDGDRARIDRQLAETAQHARTAVEEELLLALHEVAGLDAPRVRPRGRGADDGQAHVHILAHVARKIRVVIAKPGLDGHDRGAKIIARALRDAGMEVVYTGLHQTPEQIVETAIQEDADAVGISILSGAHMTLVPRILEGLKENGVEDVLVVVGGTIPKDDVAALKQQGVAEVFTPGAPVSEIVDFLRANVPVGA